MIFRNIKVALCAIFVLLLSSCKKRPVSLDEAGFLVSSTDSVSKVEEKGSKNLQENSKKSSLLESSEIKHYAPESLASGFSESEYSTLESSFSKEGDKVGSTYGPAGVFTVKDIEKGDSKIKSRSELEASEFKDLSSVSNACLASQACESEKDAGLEFKEDLESEELILKSETAQKLSKELVKQKEAKLADIPVAMGVEPIMEYFEAENRKGPVILGYYTNLEAPQIAKFYNQEMELYGWQKVFSFDGLIERSMLFKKPSRFCSISIRSQSPTRKRNYKTQIVLFVQI